MKSSNSSSAYELSHLLSVAESKYIPLCYEAAEYFEKFAQQKGSTISEEVILNETNELINSILNSADRIKVNTATKIVEYINEYDVNSSKSIDMYKAAYFFGLEVAQNLPETDYIKISLARLALVLLMDDVLLLDTGQGLMSSMKSKVLSSAIAMDKKQVDSWCNIFGQYGIYIIFKNVLKACRTDCTTNIDAEERLAPR